MLLKKNQYPILAFNLIVFLGSMVRFYLTGNREFFLYTFVIIGLFALLLLTNHKVNYPNPILWGLSLWVFVHLMGGAIPIGEGVLYGVILIPIFGDPYYVLRYDHFAHAFGFGVATLALYYLIKPSLDFKKISPTKLGIVLIFAGLGAGAVNEILEFSATILYPNNGVGGYINTSLDLIFNTIGAIIAWIFIYYKELKSS